MQWLTLPTQMSTGTSMSGAVLHGEAIPIVVKA